MATLAPSAPLRRELALVRLMLLKPAGTTLAQRSTA